MCMVLNGPYKRAFADFYLNRALRLFPCYLVVAACVLCTYLATGAPIIKAFRALPASAQWFLAVTNGLLFGQDWVVLLHTTVRGLEFVRNFNPQLSTFLLDAPAWSLGIELSFYILAPCLLRRATLKPLVAVLLLSLSVKLALFAIGFRGDPWSYRFFPSELFLFLLGALAFRLSEPLMQLGKQMRSRRGIPTLFVFSLVIFFHAVQVPQLFREAVLYAALFFFLPTIFAETSRIPLDRYVGDLSYPLYIVHWPLLKAMEHEFGSPMPRHVAILAIPLTLIAAIALKHLVDDPIEKTRARLRRRAQRAVIAAPVRAAKP